MKNRVHTNTGITDLEWFRLKIDEARGDPVGFWEMVMVGRQGFGLKGNELEQFIADFVLQMLLSGAQAVVGDKSARFGWSRAGHCPVDPHECAEFLVSDWRTSGTDPDAPNGIWFAFPSVFS